MDLRNLLHGCDRQQQDVGSLALLSNLSTRLVAKSNHLWVHIHYTGSLAHFCTRCYLSMQAHRPGL
jgi:hypothetical protein